MINSNLNNQSNLVCQQLNHNKFIFFADFHGAHEHCGSSPRWTRLSPCKTEQTCPSLLVDWM